MSVWFQGDCDIDCSIQQVQRAFDDRGRLFAGIVRLMPGMTSVELVEQTGDGVTIRTNEGVMNRTNISKNIEDGRLVVEFDERYEARSRVRTTSHFLEEFTTRDGGVMYRLIMSDVAASGLLGFLYRRFGSSRTGKAFLTATKTYLEQQAVAERPTGLG